MCRFWRVETAHIDLQPARDCLQDHLFTVASIPSAAMDQIAPLYAVAAKAAGDFLKLRLTVGGHSLDMSSVIFALGAIQFLTLSYKFLSGVTSTITKPCFSRSVRSYGEWAVVTGATDVGICGTVVPPKVPTA